MAEIRKHKPSSSPIARALEAAMGESIKPVVPGSRPDKGVEEPETKLELLPIGRRKSRPVGVLHCGDAAEVLRLIRLS
jgi:hypothetical protein